MILNERQSGPAEAETRPPAPLPLAGVRVLDFSNLLPGPLASLLLADAGADVVKVERPGAGDEIRYFSPAFGSTGANFALLNRGKRGLTADLKDDGDRAHIRKLALSANVLIEQFRPGVMERLGLGYKELSRENPRLVYCSITGYGQTGNRAQKAGHDLTYMAETGLLGLTRGADGAPVLPPLLAADIAGGAYPAVMNILLALTQRQASGRGCHLDVAMTDNLFTLAYWGLAGGHAGQWPKPGGELLSGGSPRYQIYRTADEKYLAAAPLEERFWHVFCERIGLPADERDDTRDPAATRARIADLIAGRTAEDWQAIFAGSDACVCVAASLEEAAADPAFHERGLFRRSVSEGAARMPALPLPIDEHLRDQTLSHGFPGRDARRTGWLSP
jgi:crotonobetainyl-CoA:carnitine CoA-transferase CaiB-like acyl-CoA transferase